MMYDQDRAVVPDQVQERVLLTPGIPGRVQVALLVEVLVVLLTP